MRKAQKKLASELARLRKESGLSQRDVADELGYSSPLFVSNWERGISAPPIKEFRKLAHMYSVSVGTLKELFVAREVEDVTFKIDQELAKI